QRFDGPRKIVEDRKESARLERLLQELDIAIAERRKSATPAASPPPAPPAPTPAAPAAPAQAGSVPVAPEPPARRCAPHARRAAAISSSVYRNARNTQLLRPGPDPSSKKCGLTYSQTTWRSRVTSKIRPCTPSQMSVLPLARRCAFEMYGLKNSKG